MVRTFLFLLVLFSFQGLAQDRNEKVPDSLKVYKQIERQAKKGKVTYWLYNEIFNLPNENKKKEKVRKQVSYRQYQGKIIRNINTISYDPFGYSVHDSTSQPSSFILKGGNFLHQRTTRLAILNRLLFREGDTLDYLELKESERIIRRAVQIREVVFDVSEVKGTDSVDVTIREQDYWSKSFGVSFSSDSYHFGFADKNFLGLNHIFQNDIYYQKDSARYVAFGTYTIPYLRNTFLIPSVSYSTDPDNFQRGFSLNRPFLSNLLKWAGGMDVYDLKTSTYRVFPDADTLRYSTRLFSKDFWIARSFQLGSDTSEETRSTKMIIGARLKRENFYYSAPEIISPSFNFEDSYQYLVSVALSNSTFYRDYYIYRYGVQEDVPAGRLITLTMGYEDRQTRDRFYAGVEAATGNHFDNIGYLFLKVGAGSYLWQGKPDQSILKAGVGYFSDLLELKRIRLRQFIKMDVTFGLNRIPGESLTFVSTDIRGFESDMLFGNKKAIISLQTQAYLPWSFLGFRFAPFIYLNGGLISENGRTLFQSRLYQGYGVGLLVKNELLVINTFQFAIGFYPYIPGGSSNFKLNPLRTYDFTFEDFQYQRPHVIPLQ